MRYTSAFESTIKLQGMCVCVCTIVHIANAYSRSHTHMETWEELPWIGMRLSIDNLVAIYLKLMGF